MAENDSDDRPEWTVRVDRDACIGSGMCAGSAPDYFRLDGGRSQPVAERVRPDDDVRYAAESCPMEAITVRDAATGEQVAPEA